MCQLDTESGNKICQLYTDSWNKTYQIYVATKKWVSEYINLLASFLATASTYVSVSQPKIWVTLGFLGWPPKVPPVLKHMTYYSNNLIYFTIMHNA